MTAAVEKRYLPTAELRVEANDDKQPVLRGMAAVYNSFSQDLGGFREIIKPGAFSRAVREKQDVRFLVNHDPNLLLGRTASGTLRLKDHATGLQIENDPPDTQIGKDVMESVRRGDMSQMSFGFVVKKDEWRVEGDGLLIRELLDVDLLDTSIVTYPAYLDTSVAIRSMQQFRESLVEKDEFDPGQLELLEAMLKQAMLD